MSAFLNSTSISRQPDNNGGDLEVFKGRPELTSASVSWKTYQF